MCPAHALAGHTFYFASKCIHHAVAGHIPKELGALSELRELRLWSNKLTGEGALHRRLGIFIFEFVSCVRMVEFMHICSPRLLLLKLAGTIYLPSA